MTWLIAVASALTGAVVGGWLGYRWQDMAWNRLVKSLISKALAEEAMKQAAARDAIAQRVHDAVENSRALQKEEGRAADPDSDNNPLWLDRLRAHKPSGDR
jgi:hypothetical protein